MRGDVARLQARLCERVAHRFDRRAPEVFGIVLDPAGARIVLREFLLRDGDDREILAEHDGARGGGALIEREQIGHEGLVGLDAPPPE